MYFVVYTAKKRNERNKTQIWKHSSMRMNNSTWLIGTVELKLCSKLRVAGAWTHMQNREVAKWMRVVIMKIIMMVTESLTRETTQLTCSRKRSTS